MKRLASQEGADAMADAMKMPEDRLTRITRLRKRFPEDLTQAAVEQLELRKRAKAKFENPDKMLFTREGLEQSTGRRVADYHASRFPVGATVLDACCGIGGDAISLAKRGEVVAVDQNPVAAFCTHYNFEATVSDPSQLSRLKTLAEDVCALPLGALKDEGVAFAFFDPSRRADSREGGRRRVVSGEDYSPPLSWISELRANFSGSGVKVSPALDDETLLRMKGTVELVSDRGECKEALIWFDELSAGLPTTNNRPGFPIYQATILREGRPPERMIPFDCPDLDVSEPQNWLIEPDPAIIRAHLTPQIAQLHGAKLIDFSVAYLTAEDEVLSPFATSYRIIETLDCNFKTIQARLRSLGGKIIEVKKRNVPYEPEKTLKILKPGGDRPLTLILSPGAGGHLALICEPAKRTLPQA